MKVTTRYCDICKIEVDDSNHIGKAGYGQLFLEYLEIKPGIDICSHCAVKLSAPIREILTRNKK